MFDQDWTRVYAGHFKTPLTRPGKGESLMKCSRCQHENPDDAKFCEECAPPFERVCTNCGTRLRPNAKFCHQCAHPAGGSPSGEHAKLQPTAYTPKHLADRILTSRAAIEGERKQVTVLFADLTGSMELLADRDPEEARAILDPVLAHMMDAVHVYEGTVNQVMGDGIMALFGAPLSQEDHAVRACYAALRMQAAIRAQGEKARSEYGVSIQARVGINSGEVLVRSIGSDLKMDYSAIGQTTHLAARMEQLAAGGTTLVTPDTLRLAEGFVQVETLGPAAVKGMNQPVEVYELTGALGRRSRLQARAASGGLTQFVGRKHEFEVLTEAAKRAKQGKGQAVAIVGEPGVGKSRLYWEFAHSHHTHGCLVVEASSVSYGKATSFLPVIDLLKSYFEIGERDDTRSVKEKLTGKLLTLDRQLEPLLPPLLALLDLPVEDEQWKLLDPPQRRHQTLEALKQLWLREAQNQPLVLVFEDLHWVDSETQAFLNELLEKIPATHILLLFNYRPEYRHPWGNKTFYNQLRLDTLPVESAEELLTSLLGTDAKLGPLKQMLIKRGNPFFLEETVRTLVETGTLEGGRGNYHLTRSVETLQMPATVQAILAARIDRLEVEDKRLLQTASVIGKDVPFALLNAITDLNESELAQTLARLQAAEFVYEAGTYPNIEYTFKHALTHEVAYKGLTQDRKQRLHARIVDAIERIYANRIDEHIERLSHHALRGEVWDKSVKYLRLAGQRAFARSANTEAASWWEQALTATEHLPDGRDMTNLQIDIRLELRGPLFTLGQLAKSIEHVKVAQTLSEQVGDRYRTALALAYQVQPRLFACDLDDALTVGQQALSIANDGAYVDDQVIAGLFLPHLIQAEGAPREAEAQQKANLAILLKIPDRARFGLPALPSIYAHGLYAQMAADFGNFAQAFELLQKAIDVARQTSLPYSQAYARFSACIVNWARGEFENAIHEGEEGIRICNAHGIRMFRIWISMYLAMAYALAGRATEAISLFEERLPEFDPMGIVYGRLIALPLLAEVYFLGGNREAALKAAEDAIELQDEKKTRLHRPRTLAILGRIHAHPDHYDPQKAERLFKDAIQGAEGQGSRVLAAHSHADLGRLKLSMGSQPEAKEELACARLMYREMSMPNYLKKAEKDLGQLS
jgi:class 3 adenylate cyclase/tetratricopeptide (TPR) repeat protein